MSKMKIVEENSPKRLAQLTEALRKRAFELWPLTHLLVSLLLHVSAVSIVVSSMTDVIMDALCPGLDECSQVIYLTGLQKAVSGVGIMILSPVIGKLSDHYGRKLILLLGFTLSTLPNAVLSFSRSKEYIYAFYILKTFVSMVTDGGITCVALAYVADTVKEKDRPSAFALFAGVMSSGYVISVFASCIISESNVFKVSAMLSVIPALYVKLFLVESRSGKPIAADTCEEPLQSEIISLPSISLLRKRSFVRETFDTLKMSPILVQMIVIAFFLHFGEDGLHSMLWYYLKATFQFGKDEFSQLMLVSGIASMTSQFLFLPILIPILQEKKAICIGLLSCCTSAFLFGFAWARWVPYMSASASVLSVLVFPCMVNVVSKEAGPTEQGKFQGIIAGARSFAGIISPLVMTPLTAAFLSEDPPFRCRGFPLICVGLSMMVALVQAFFMRQPSKTSCALIASNYDAEYGQLPSSSIREPLLGEYA